MTGVSSLSLTILVPAIPGLVAKFAADPASVQLTISLYLLGLAAAQLVFGPLSDRFGRRPVVLAGLAIATIASTAAIFAASIAGLIIARVFQSLGASTGQTIGRAIIRDLYDREHAASMIGLVASVVVLMPMLAPFIGGVLDTLFGWESIFIFSAALSLTVFLWAVVALPETRQFSTVPGGRRFSLRPRRASGEPSLLRLRAVRGAGLGAVLQLSRRRPHVVVTMLGRTSAEYGLWFFIPSFGFMAGNFAVSRLTMAFRHRRPDLVGDRAHHRGLPHQCRRLCRLPGLGAGAIFLPQLIIGFGNGLLLPTAVAGAVSIRPQVAGTASGMTGFVQMGIGAGAAQLAGHAIAGASSAMPMLLLMLFFGVATAVAVFALVRGRA